MADKQFEYDVFLRHASADNAAVRELAQRLKGDGREAKCKVGRVKVEADFSSPFTLRISNFISAAFASEWVTLERHTALFRDPTNQQRRFIPLRLDDREIKDSLKQFSKGITDGHWN